MKLKNASSWFSFLMVLGAAWSFASSDFASAQTNQENYVVRDPVATGARYEQRPSSKSGHQSQYGQQPATRNFQPPRWASTVIPIQEQESPEEKLDRDVDSIQLDDQFQDELKGEIQESVELDEEQESPRRRTEMDFGDWPKKKLGEIRVSVKDDNDVVPPDYSYLLTQRTEPDWFTLPSGRKVFAWAAPNIRYQPLYFQNVPLERYGQTYGGLKQIGASGWHFFVSTVKYPFAMIVDPPRSCDYPLGYCRPGNPTSLTFQKLLNRLK